MKSLANRFGLVLCAVCLAACSKDAAPTNSSEANSSAVKPNSSTAPSAGAKTLNIWWFQWAPADGLQELGNEFKKATGVEVKVTQIPLPSYQDKVFLEAGNSRTAFDIVIGDSQWIGRGATTGLYVDLSQWLPTVVDLKTIHPRAARYLCVYPEGSDKWFAAPCETDADGLAYRKDWFEDPKEKAAFKAKYGRELTVPDSWDDFKQVAEFFYRPSEKRYGCALQTGRGYDCLTMGVQNLLWCYGGNWHAEDSMHVVGALDTPAAAAAIERFKELVKFGPSKAENLDYSDVLEAFSNGSTAMMLNYFAFFPGVYKQFGDKVGFAIMPGKDGKHIASLGGQGLSISSKIPKEQQELAKQFIAWFEKRETQEQWITKPAGFTANTEILKSDAFRKQTPYNAPFADSIETMRDFWNVPCYNELLSATQKYVGKAVDGQMETPAALKALAEEKERILTEAGLLH